MSEIVIRIFTQKGRHEMDHHKTRESEHLGSIVRVFKTSVWSYWWAVLISCLLLMLIFLLWGITDRDSRSHMDVLPAYLILGVLAALPILGIIYQIKNQARFYENGVEYENRRWIKTAHWAEIQDVWEWCVVVNVNGIPTPQQAFYFIRTFDGMIIKFSPRLDEIEKLGAFLKSEAIERRVPIRSGVPSRGKP